jgi:hypothetical protein
MSLDPSRLSHILRLVCACLTLFTPLLLKAQNSAQIRIDVKDPSGAAVTASGILRTPGGSSLAFETDSSGSYTFTNLGAGRYRLGVSKTGFATQSLPIEVTAGVNVSRTIML